MTLLDDSRKEEIQSQAILLVAEKIDRAMRLTLMTQEQFAARAGIAPNTVSRILRGYDVRLSTLEKCAKAIGAALPELFR